jgi:hypothetical protein
LALCHARDEALAHEGALGPLTASLEGQHSNGMSEQTINAKVS